MMNRAPYLVALLLAACTTEGPLTPTVAAPPAAVQPQPVAPAPVAAAPLPVGRTVDPTGAPVEIEEAEVISTTPPPPPSEVPTAVTAASTSADADEPVETASASATAETAPPAASSGSQNKVIGTTTATVDASLSAFEFKTPLVSERQNGVVVSKSTGKVYRATLVPAEGPPGGGSQASVTLLRLLGEPLDGISTIEVRQD